MKAAILLFLLFLCSYNIVPHIEGYNAGLLKEKGLDDIHGDVLQRIFGEFRLFLSDNFYLNVDLYYHGGIGHEDHDEHDDCLFYPHEEDKPGDLTSTGHHHHTGHRRFMNPLLRLADELELHEHRHLSPEEEKELLPWFFYSARLDPNNEKAYEIGGYWLGMRLDDPVRAIDFLKEGIENNPDSWRLHLILGEIYLTMTDDHDNARIVLEKSKDLIDLEKIDRFALRHVYGMLAEAYYKSGAPEMAVKVSRDLLKYFPENKTILQRIEYFETPPPKETAPPR